jgi:tetratricopeptide (TPR) repeat protein
MKPKDETQKILRALDEARSARGWGGAGWLDRKLSKSPGYVARLLVGKPAIRLEQVFDILNVLEYEAGEFFAWVFGSQCKLDPDRILRRLESGVEKSELLIRIDKILTTHHRHAEQQAEESPGQDQEAELNRLNELRFSYPVMAKTESLELLRLVVAEIEDGRGSLHYLCDCLSLAGGKEGILSNIPMQAAYLRRAFSLSDLLDSPRRKASLLQKCSYLVADLGNYDAALSLEEQACKIYIFLKDLSGIGQTLVDQGNMHFYLGEPLVSVQCYTAALGYIPRQMWTYRFSTYQCLGFTYLHLGEVEKAQKYADLAGQAHETRDGPNWWRLTWLRGEIALLQADLSFAETAFLKISDAFLAEENYVDAALVALRLAKVFLLAGKLKKMQRVSSGMIALMDPLKLKNDIARSTIHEFIKLALIGEVTEDFLDRAHEKVQLVTGRKSLASEPS